MADVNGWPSDVNSGVPDLEDMNWPHVLVNEFGQRQWAFWLCHPRIWIIGTLAVPPEYAGERYRYIGPGLEPD